MSTRTLYHHPVSGHAHRAALALSLFGIPVTLQQVDLTARAHKSPEYLAMNTFGQVPVLVDEDGTVVADSNAILVYLAARYDSARAWLPTDPAGQAAVQRWFSVAAGQLAYGPAAARRALVFKRPADMDALIAASHALLAVVEQELTGDWLVGDRPSLADISMYTYVALAPEGNVSLDGYPRVRAWLARIEALPGFVPMMRSPVGLGA
jgi:glutathione S-transferase